MTNRKGSKVDLNINIREGPFYFCSGRERGAGGGGGGGGVVVLCCNIISCTEFFLTALQDIVLFRFTVHGNYPNSLSKINWLTLRYSSPPSLTDMAYLESPWQESAELIYRTTLASIEKRHRQF